MMATRCADTLPPIATVTFLFTDIEGSSRLWDTVPDSMRPALARHDAILRAAVEGSGGSIVKSTGDGIHAAFSDPLQAVDAAIELLSALADSNATEGVQLNVRCGIHTGVIEQRDGDFFGGAVNRAARIMSVAHGGQALVSEVVADLVRGRLPRDVSLQDVGTVRLRDMAHPESVSQIMHPRLRHEFPALRSLESAPNNLPLQMTRFIGREREIAEVRELLGRARLVTLSGMGGLGKTRLALEIAVAVLDEYPDGVWFVELTQLADALLVPQAVASALGVKETGGESLTDALDRHVADKRLLLILDNCEHLVEACATFAHRMLQAGPQIGIIVTSRERLNVAGEQTYAVASLPVPGVAQEGVEALLRFEAVRLFVDRASAAQSGFCLSKDNAQAVATICRTLDGIPLAIELAAARVPVLSVMEIAARLADRLRLLTGGIRNTAPHHQTLRASIDWSHDLLTPSERALFRRLSIFAGGWTLEAAEAVAPDGELTTHDVLDRIADLIDKSLVILDASSGRYRMLETVRQYALEQLAHARESEATRSRHVHYYVTMLEETYDNAYGKEQGDWFARLHAERENLLAAHAACDLAERGTELGLSLVFRTKPYWIRQGLLGLGYRVTREAVDRVGSQSRAARGRGLSALGEICSFMGRYTEALQHLEESLAIARELGDKDLAAADLNTLCMASLGCSDLARARRYSTEGLAVARELGDKRTIAAMLVSLAQLNRSEGALDVAEPQYAEALALMRELGDRESVAVVLLNLAMVAISRTAPSKARDTLRKALAIIEEIGSNRVGQSALDVVAALAAAVGDWSRAAHLHGAVNAEMDATGLQREPADEAFLRPLMELTRQALGDGAFAKAILAGEKAGYQEVIGESRRWLNNGC
jgi:predicted ATPase/class 3 adenylate cyclase